MTVTQEPIHTGIRRALEGIGALFFAFLGSGALVLSVKSLLQLIGELAWRLPKGRDYLHWDMLLMMGLFVISSAMLSASFLVAAKSFWDNHWSLRTVILVTSLAIAGFCACIVFVAMLGAGLSGID